MAGSFANPLRMIEELPSLKAYSFTEDKFYEMLPTLGEEELELLEGNNVTVELTCEVDIPSNESYLTIVHKFELYKDDIATGKILEIIVAPNIPNYEYSVLGFDSDQKFFSPEGGTATLTVLFGHQAPLFMKVDVPLELRNGTLYTFVSSNGSIFLSTSDVSNPGIWKYDISTQAFDYVHDIGYSWMYWFEANNGMIFVSSNNAASPGIMKWNGTTFSVVFPTTYDWMHWFESREGDIFVSANLANVNVLRWDGFAFVDVGGASIYNQWAQAPNGFIYTSGPLDTGNSNPRMMMWNGTSFQSLPTATGSPIQARVFGATPFISSQNVVFFSTQYANAGINYAPTCRIAEAGQLNSAVIGASHRTLQRWFETPDGDIYGSSPSPTEGGVLSGIYKLAGGGSIYDYPYTVGYNYNKQFTLPDDSMLVTSDSAPNTGIVRINEGTVTQIYGIGQGWLDHVYYNEELEATFMSSDQAGSIGILMLDEQGIRRVYEEGIGWGFEYDKLLKRIVAYPLLRGQTNGKLMFNDRTMRFELIVEQFSGSPFGLYGSHLSNTGQNVLWHYNEPVLLDDQFGTNINSSSTRNSIAFNPTKTKMLISIV